MKEYVWSHVRTCERAEALAGRAEEGRDRAATNAARLEAELLVVVQRRLLRHVVLRRALAQRPLR